MFFFRKFRAIEEKITPPRCYCISNSIQNVYNYSRICKNSFICMQNVFLFIRVQFSHLSLVFFEFSTFFLYYSSVREIIRETSCFSFFCSFHTIFIDFLHFSGQAAFFLLFISLFDFAVTFLLFMVLTFFLFYTCFPPPSLFLACFFLFLRTILRFPHLSTLFIPSLCFFTPYRYFFIAFFPFAASLTCFFRFFRPYLTVFTSFQPFFAFSPLIFIFFAVFRLFRLYTPLFAIFSLLLMSLSQDRFLRFTPFKMFHVKHRFSRFSVFSGQ